MFPVPKDFSEVLSDLTKEILKAQPQDILEFSALYFKSIQEGKTLNYSGKGKLLIINLN